MTSSFSAVSGSVVGRWVLAVLAVVVGVVVGPLPVGGHVATTTGGGGPDEVTGIVTQYGSVRVHNCEVAGLHPYTITSSGHYSHNCPTDYGDAANSVPNPKPVLKSDGTPDRRSSPWYVSCRDADGNLQTVGNLDGVHAEVRIQQMMPGAPMSKPFDWRVRDAAKGPEWVEGTVCGGCQQYPRTLFPPGTRGAAGGPWGDQ